jgi:thioredoxin reductase (NADPH)
MAQVENGNIQFYPETVPVEITPQHVVLRPTQEGVPILDDLPIIHPTDFVLLASGFRADMSLFEIAGVELEGPRRVPAHDPETMETNIPGLYIAGTAAAGALQDRYRLFIENSHEHVIKIVKALTGRLPDRIGSIPGRNYELALKEIEAN